jgi:phosphate uptake regulator
MDSSSLKGFAHGHYPALLGLEESRREAARQLSLALKSIERFGDEADVLRGAARFVVERQV